MLPGSRIEKRIILPELLENAFSNTRPVRLCIYLREHKAIVVNAFPLPRADKLLHRLADVTVSCKLDLQSAYHQVLLAEKNRELATFITHDGLFCFQRVCFGLASAP